MKKKVKSKTRTDTPLVQECPSRNNIKLSEFDWGGTNLYVCCHEKQEEDKHNEEQHRILGCT